MRACSSAEIVAAALLADDALGSSAAGQILATDKSTAKMTRVTRVMIVPYG